MSDNASARIADKYIGRDGSDVSKGTGKTLVRAAVFAAQAKLAEVLGVAKSPIKDKDMHSIIVAAWKASPEIFER